MHRLWIGVFVFFLRNMTIYLLDLAVFVIQWQVLIVQRPFAVHVYVFSLVFHMNFRLVRFVILIEMFITLWPTLVRQIF